MLTLQVDIKVIEKTTEDYVIEGKSLTVNKVRAIINDEIFDFRFKGDTMRLFNELPPKGNASVTLGITSVKEKTKVAIIEVKAK